MQALGRVMGVERGDVAGVAAVIESGIGEHISKFSAEVRDGIGNASTKVLTDMCLSDFNMRLGDLNLVKQGFDFVKFWQGIVSVLEIMVGM